MIKKQVREGGGLFAPVLGGLFGPEKGGQFAPARGWSFCSGLRWSFWPFFPIRHIMYTHLRNNQL